MTVFCTAIQSVQVTQGMGDLTVTSSEAINTSTSTHDCVKDWHQIHSILGQNIQEAPPSPTTHPQSSGLVKRKHKVPLPSLKRPSGSQQERVVIKLLLHYEHKNNSAEKMIYLQLVHVSCDLLIILSMSESYFQDRRQRI